MARSRRVIPVAVIAGPVGVGKSTVLHEADELLAGAGVPHASGSWRHLPTVSRVPAPIAGLVGPGGAPAMLLDLGVDPRHGMLRLAGEAVDPRRAQDGAAVAV